MPQTRYRFTLGKATVEVQIYRDNPETARLMEAMAAGAKAAGGTVVVVTTETKEVAL